MTATLEHLDPATLIIDDNVRHDPALDKDFVASIKAAGVLQPVTAIRVDGQVRLRLGQRRTLGAIEAGQPVIPVIVHDAADPDEAKRITDQLTENLQRAELTAADEVRAVQDLLDLGITAGQIQRRTRIPKPVVDKAAKVGASELATKAMQRWTFLTLDMAAGLAEFDGDPHAVKMLTAVAKEAPSMFAHRLQGFRQQRDDALAKTAAEDAWTAAGGRLGNETALGWRAHIAHLRDAGGGRITAEDHAACPGQVAVFTVGWDYENRDSDGDPTRTWKPDLYCDDPQRYGHVQEPENGGRITEDPEAKTAERRKVIANNKAWKAATTVRQAWLADIAQRAAVPIGWKVDGQPVARFIMEAVVRGDVRMVATMNWQFNEIGCRLLGIEKDEITNGGQVTSAQGKALIMLRDASDRRAEVITAALILGAYERDAQLGTWRNPTEASRWYLRTLEAWGYALSDIERLTLGEDPGDDGE